MISPISDEQLAELDTELAERIRDDDRWMDGISIDIILALRERLRLAESL